MTDSTNKDWGTASQTQEITYNSLHDAVQKSGRQVDVGEAADTVEYTVIVNPDGQTILGNPDIKLTLVDDLAYTYDPWHNNMLITLKPSSVAVYEYDKATNALGSPLTVSEYSYLYETIGYGSGSGNENRINRLTFTLPNAKPLAVVYRYLSNASHDITLNNTATLLAQDKKSPLLRIANTLKSLPAVGTPMPKRAYTPTRWIKTITVCICPVQSSVFMRGTAPKRLVFGERGNRHG